MNDSIESLKEDLTVLVNEYAQDLPMSLVLAELISLATLWTYVNFENESAASHLVYESMKLGTKIYKTKATDRDIC